MMSYWFRTFRMFAAVTVLIEFRMRQPNLWLTDPRLGKIREISF